MIEETKRVGMKEQPAEVCIGNRRAFRILGQELKSVLDPLKEPLCRGHPASGAIVCWRSRIRFGFRPNDQVHHPISRRSRCLTSGQDEPGLGLSPWMANRPSRICFCSSVTGRPLPIASNSSHNSLTSAILSLGLSCWMSGNFSAITHETVSDRSWLRKWSIEREAISVAAAIACNGRPPVYRLNQFSN